MNQELSLEINSDSGYIFDLDNLSESNNNNFNLKKTAENASYTEYLFTDKTIAWSLLTYGIFI